MALIATGKLFNFLSRRGMSIAALDRVVNRSSLSNCKLDRCEEMHGDSIIASIWLKKQFIVESLFILLIL